MCVLESDDEPPADGSQFDVVDRFSEPEPGDLGPPIPEAPDPSSDGDVHPRIWGIFWGMLILIKLALLATALGLMFVGFEGNLDLGGKLLAAGLLLFAYGAYRYRDAKREVARLADESAPGDGDGR